jgi:hypothetical protein
MAIKPNIVTIKGKYLIILGITIGLGNGNSNVHNNQPIVMLPTLNNIRGDIRIKGKSLLFIKLIELLVGILIKVKKNNLNE